MSKRHPQRLRKWPALCGLLLLFAQPVLMTGEPAPAAFSAFNSYIQAVESRLASQHRSRSNFVAAPAGDRENSTARLHQGELLIERLTPSPSANAEPTGALLHDWRGTAFAPGAKAADFERLLRDFSSYPRHFAPQVRQARVLTQDGDRVSAWMRVRQKHVLSVVMDTTYDVTFGHLDPQHGYSISRSTHIAEIDSPGTNSERSLSPREEHGFIWRLNTYWSYEERDGGLYLQIESVSLTPRHPKRSGLGDPPLCRKHPPRVARVHLAIRLQRPSQLTNAPYHQTSRGQMTNRYTVTQKATIFISKRRVSGCAFVFPILLWLVSGEIVSAQAPSSAEAPSAVASEAGTDCAYANVFVGPAAATGDGTTKATFSGGLTFGQYFARPLGKGLVASPQFELGVIGPLPHGYPLDGLASVDFMFANKLPHRNLYPFLTGGYTRMFATGNAVNFGLGLDLGVKNSDTLVRIELRDYYVFTGPEQHVVGLRIGLGKLIAD